MKITVVGLGYVGLPLALLLTEYHEVTGIDTDKNKLKLLRAGTPPIKEDGLLPLLNQHKLRLLTSDDAQKREAYGNADFIIIAVPTNYAEAKNCFETQCVNQVLREAIAANSKAAIIIKSTVPVGFTESARKKFGYEKIYFSPEFLREGKAIHDNCNPSRIIVGRHDENAEAFAALMKQISKKNDTEVVFMGDTEAESVKLFSNTYLAMRVAFFNELDTYAEYNALNTEKIIRGVCADPRIGNYYNNPSFGYGGYCLPKDSKQLAASYENIPNEIIKATVASNATRIKYIAERVMAQKPETVGIYRLQAKSGSDNFKQSAIISVMDILKERGVNLLIYEPILDTAIYNGIPVIADAEEFKRKSDIILCNRKTPLLADVLYKTYTKDLFGEC